MRSTLILSTIAAAAVSVSALDCNPSYNVAPSTTCFTNCNKQAGSKFYSSWTMDSTSPHFIPSLAVMCVRGTAQYSEFMTTAGMCMMSCTGDDPELFNAEWSGACAWYNQHANDVCTTSTTAAPTTTKATTTTTTTNAVVTTTTGSAAVTTPAAVGASSAASAAVSAVVSGAPAITAVGSSVVANVPASSSAGAAPAVESTSGANKLQLGSYAVALVAAAGYLAL